MKILVIDTETGGLNPESQSILSLAALVVSNGVITDQMYTLINEGANIIAEGSALTINGLTMSQIHSEGVTPSVAVDLLTAMLERQGLTSNVIICAHKAAFDVGFLRRLYRLAGRDFDARFSHRHLCTHAVAIFLKYVGLINPKDESLSGLAGYFGIPLDRDRGHNALSDALALAGVLSDLSDVALGEL